MEMEITIGEMIDYIVRGEIGMVRLNPRSDSGWVAAKEGVLGGVETENATMDGGDGRDCGWRAGAGGLLTAHALLLLLLLEEEERGSTALCS